MVDRCSSCLTVSNLLLDCPLKEGANLLGMDVHDASSAAELVVGAAKVDRANVELAKRRSTHDARLDGNVKVGLFEDRDIVVCEDLFDRHKLRMTGTLSR